MTTLAPRPTADAALQTHLPPLLPRQDPITHLPIVVLYPHSRCNCRCVMCDIWKSKERIDLSASDVAGWIEEWQRLGVQRVLLSGGEPMMHSNLWELCAVLRGAGIGISMLSTGLLLKRWASEVGHYVDDVVVSIDGPPAVHDDVRRIPGAFAKLAEGVAALKAVAPAVSVTARCTVQQLNFRHLRETVRATQAAGLDRVSFLAVDVDTEAFNRPGGWDAERARAVALAEADLPLLLEEIALMEQECAHHFASGFIAENADKLRRRLHGHFASILGQGDSPPASCNAPWVSAVIETDGSVRPCFFQPALGNLRSSGSLDAVINSPAAREWRSRLDVQQDPICRRCVCSLSLRAGAPSLDPAAG